jgi:hypothetical protein
MVPGHLLVTLAQGERPALPLNRHLHSVDIVLGDDVTGFALRVLLTILTGDIAVHA